MLQQPLSKDEMAVLEGLGADRRMQAEARRLRSTIPGLNRTVFEKLMDVFTDNYHTTRNY